MSCGPFRRLENIKLDKYFYKLAASQAIEDCLPFAGSGWDTFIGSENSVKSLQFSQDLYQKRLFICIEKKIREKFQITEDRFCPEGKDIDFGVTIFYSNISTVAIHDTTQQISRFDGKNNITTLAYCYQL